MSFVLTLEYMLTHLGEKLFSGISSNSSSVHPVNLEEEELLNKLLLSLSINEIIASLFSTRA
jgi:hypothetical protein